MIINILKFIYNRTNFLIFSSYLFLFGVIYSVMGMWEIQKGMCADDNSVIVYALTGSQFLGIADKMFILSGIALIIWIGQKATIILRRRS